MEFKYCVPVRESQKVSIQRGKILDLLDQNDVDSSSALAGLISGDYFFSFSLLM